LIVDLLTFVGESLHGYAQTAEQLLARMDEVGIDRAVICPVKPRGYHLGPENDRVAAAARASARLILFARVDPWLGGQAVDELDRAVTNLGACGLFLHPWEETFRINDPLVAPLAARAAELAIPLLVATGYPWVSEAAQVGDLARRYPALRIIMTHGGQINISGLGQFDAGPTCRSRPRGFIGRTSSKRRRRRSGRSGSFSAATARGWTRASRSSGCAGRACPRASER
jgi:hypothetical protein